MLKPTHTAATRHRLKPSSPVVADSDNVLLLPPPLRGAAAAAAATAAAAAAGGGGGGGGAEVDSFSGGWPLPNGVTHQQG